MLYQHASISDRKSDLLTDCTKHENTFLPTEECTLIAKSTMTLTAESETELQHVSTFHH